MVEATTKAKGLKAMLEELGFRSPSQMVLMTDSSAARAFAARRGVGRMRHVETRLLWLQAEVQQQRVALVKIPGKENPADVLTKYLDEKDIVEHLSRLRMTWVRP